MFALVDCNNFYASCERVFNPNLRNKPIVILSNNDGCIIARSNEAKALGLKMGDPYFMVKDKLKQHGVAVFSSNYTLYGDMSARVMQTLEQFSPEIECYSIDEAFLNLQGFKQDLTTYAVEIRRIVKQWTGIPVSVGIAPTKTLAKIANYLAKKTPELNGVMELNNLAILEMALANTPVQDIWGIGRQSARFLLHSGIDTALKFRDCDNRWVRQHLHVVGLRTVEELRGISCIPLELVSPLKKGITTSRSFGKKVTDKEELKQALVTYTSRAAEKLRASHLQASNLYVFIRTNPFSKTDKWFSNAKCLTLPHPTNYTPELVQYAAKCLDAIYRPGFSYTKCGITFTDLVQEGAGNLDLFYAENSAKQQALMQALDKLNRNYGKDTVFLAGTGIKQRWRMLRSHQSPHYTTDLNAVIKAIA